MPFSGTITFVLSSGPQKIERHGWLIEIKNFNPLSQNPPAGGNEGTKLKTMYALKNKVQLIGNLGGKPEVKNTESGKKLAQFSIATNESYRNAKGEKVTETQWHRIVAWGKLAEIAEKYLDKGKEVAIEGKLVNRSYIDKDGNKKYITEIQLNELLMLGTKPAES